MRSNIHLSLAVLGAVGTALAAGLPAMAQSGRTSTAGTPITDQYGFTGTSPNAATWLERINEQHKLPTATPVTTAQSSDIPVWAESIKEKYGIPSKMAKAGTPVTDQYGAVGTSPDSAAWRENMKETYKIGTGA